jgi:Mlc titration factor MtfA (ptsG expression regulator)
VLHEFAHQLDQIDGAAYGTPTLGGGNCHQTWGRVLGEEYERLVRNTRKGRKTLLDKYGATNIAEFFSVCTECFFEKPRQLAKKHPELYDELMAYYGVDPRDWA